MSVPLLSMDGLTVDFRSQDRWVRAVDGVSLDIYPGETVCLVGESGSGKSVTAQSLTRLLPSPPARYTSGSVILDGKDLMRLPGSQLRRYRGRKVSYIFQEPGACLNPVMRVEHQIRETLAQHRPEKNSREEVVRLLTQVGIPAPEQRLREYPHHLSGGMQQRVMIAMALASEPELLVADEPTTALDVTIQAQILDLLVDIKQRTGMAILLITHNLGIVSRLADRVAVLYAGQVVESGTAAQVLHAPRHPYTDALLRSVPELGRSQGRLVAIPGTVPAPGEWGSGCRFADRCPRVQDLCHQQAPPWEPWTEASKPPAEHPEADPTQRRPVVSGVRCFYPLSPMQDTRSAGSSTVREGEG